LFSLVENEKETNWDYVEKALWMLLLHSKSASLYAVAASLAVAYPVRLYDILLFLCQDIRFISMDLTRSISEQHATLIEFAYHQYPSLLEERNQTKSPTVSDVWKQLYSIVRLPLTTEMTKIQKKN